MLKLIMYNQGKFKISLIGLIKVKLSKKHLLIFLYQIQICESLADLLR